MSTEAVEQLPRLIAQYPYCAAYRMLYCIALANTHSIDLGRLRVHSDESMQNKLLVGFVATVLMSKMNQVMNDHNFYKNYTMRELQKTLERQRVHEIRGQKILTPSTCEQKKVYAAFDIAPPS